MSLDVSMEYVTWGQFLKVNVKGQGHQRSKGQNRRLAISRKLLGRFTPNKDQNVQLVKSFPPICLVLEFHFRSKSSPEVKCQIHIFGHNSKSIGRIDLKQRPLDSSRRAAQKCCSYFSSFTHTFFCTVFKIFAILCFFGLIVIGPGFGCGSRVVTRLL